VQQTMTDYEASLHEAMAAGFNFQSQGPSGLSKRDRDELFLYAVRRNYTRRARELLESGADVHARTRLGTTALMEAAALGYTEMVRLLLAAGADPHARTPGGKTAFDEALENQRHEVLAMLRSGPEAVRKSRSVPETGPQDSDLLPVAVMPMTEIDLQTKSAILAMRRRSVESYPQIWGAPYAPSRFVFGELKSGKPWWGLLGKFYYGRGMLSSEGPSLETRFLNNPLLLIGLQETQPHEVTDEKFPATAVCPEPLSMMWHRSRLWARVLYSIREYHRYQDRVRHPDAGSRQFVLNTYNAKDYGFNHMAIDWDQSWHVLPLARAKGIRALRDALRVARHCGIAGGCNDAGDPASGIVIGVLELPAVAVIKLWQWRPASEAQIPDMIFVIEMI